MKRKIFSILFALVLMLALTGGPAVAAKQTIVHVNPGDSIQAAVDTSGVTKVIVHAGVYNEGVVFGLENSGITLQGGDGAILDGTTLGNTNAITIDEASGVTIRNFEIRNYGGQGIRTDETLDETPDVYFSGLTLRNLNIHHVGSQNGHAHTIDIRNGTDVIIQNVTIVVDAGTKWWAEGIRLQSIVGVRVINVDVDGGWVGVNFALSTEAELGPPTSGVIKGSTFSNNTRVGIFLASTTDARVTGNVVTGTGEYPAGAWGTGILVGFGPVTITNVTISGNEVVGNDDGIVLIDTDDSVVSENTVLNSLDWGIGLIVGSTGNEITGNTATGNAGFDLFHDASSTPNTWDNNTYGTKSGGDIP